MKRYRSIVSLLLVAMVVFLTSCSAPDTVKGPTYSPEQIAQLQKYTADVEEMRDRLLAIPPLVQQGRWNDVQTYIHGPLGEMRARMSRLARGLEPKLQKPALNAAKEVFEHIVLIDEATLSNDSRKALFNYNQTLQDFDAFLKFVPAEVNATT